MQQLITYIGLDVHKETVAVALAEAGKRSEVREYGKIANTPAAVKALAAKLARNGHELRFCYEAGPCGYGIQRQLTVLEHSCISPAAQCVVSPGGSSSVRATTRCSTAMPSGGMRDGRVLSRSGPPCPGAHQRRRAILEGGWSAN